MENFDNYERAKVQNLADNLYANVGRSQYLGNTFGNRENDAYSK